MKSTTNLDMFEKVIVKRTSANSRGLAMTARLSKKNAKRNNAYTNLILSSDLSEKLAWIPGDRVDLYRCGKTFMLKPCDVGLLTLRSVAPTSKQLSVNSTDACREIHAFGKAELYDAWIEDEILFFKPKAE